MEGGGYSRTEEEGKGPSSYGPARAEQRIPLGRSTQSPQNPEETWVAGTQERWQDVW